jgi:hypothetical protein
MVQLRPIIAGPFTVAPFCKTVPGPTITWWENSYFNCLFVFLRVSRGS